MRADKPLVDFHCHLARSGGIAALNPTGQERLIGEPAEPRVVAVTSNVSEWRTLSVVNRDAQIVWALGLHPGERHTNTTVSAFMAAVPDAVAIGEVGLDFRRTVSTDKEVQRRRLEGVLDAIDGRPKLVSLHSAGATAAVVNCLRGRELPGAVLHWFLGSPKEVDVAVDLDLFFSVNTSMTRSKRGRAAIDAMPPNRVVLETDAPYGIASKNIPVDLASHLNAVIAALARLWRLPDAETREQVIANQEVLVSRAGLHAWGE